MRSGIIIDFQEDEDGQGPKRVHRAGKRTLSATSSLQEDDFAPKRVHRAERRTLSATSISRHFALSNCERMLRLDSELYSVRNEFLHNSGRAAGQYRPREDTVAAVMTRRGIVFEASLQTRLQENEIFLCA